MSDLQQGTIKERLARIETLICNHLQHHQTLEKWLLGICGTLLTAFLGETAYLIFRLVVSHNIP